MSKNYETPEIEVGELISEGVLCESGSTESGNSFNYYDEVIGW